jgi:hypothetical protein
MKHTKNQTTVNINTMSLYELCRWAALKDAVDIIGDKCDEKSINFDSFDLKPLDLLKYVDIATDTLYNKVLTNEIR